jgi:hypothetical protein
MMVQVRFIGTMTGQIAAFVRCSSQPHQAMTGQLGPDVRAACS